MMWLSSWLGHGATAELNAGSITERRAGVNYDAENGWDVRWRRVIDTLGRTPCCLSVLLGFAKAGGAVDRNLEAQFVSIRTGSFVAGVRVRSVPMGRQLAAMVACLRLVFKSQSTVCGAEMK